MPDLDTLPQILRNSLLAYPCLLSDTEPFTPLAKELRECRLAVVTTAGLHLKTDPPFATAKAEGDPSYRVIPSSVDPHDLLQSHPSIQFDQSAIQRDINVAFPMERLRELVQHGDLGSLAENFYSFVGAQRDPRLVRDQTGPEVAKRLKDDEVDVVLLGGT